MSGPRWTFALLALFTCFVPRWAQARVGGTAIGEPARLEVPGASDAYFYRPASRGAKPVLMYLHGRGGNPAEDCRKWAKVGTQFGWVLCPQGPEDRGGGSRAWQNSVTAGQSITDAALSALREKYKGRVKKRGHVLIGFSEGAYVAMQMGLTNAPKYDRWLILAANDQYWFGDAVAKLHDQRKNLRRVYLVTGENDEVVDRTRTVYATLKEAKVPAKVRIVRGMGHELPKDRMVATYRRPLLWLTR